jgi:hypothetical protein
MKRLDFPVDIPSDPIGELQVDELRLVSKLGLPHDASDDATEFAGPVKLWAFELESGIRVVVEYHTHKRLAYIACDPPDLEAAVDGLGLPRSMITWRRSR